MGWWLATDGKWYPPDLHPAVRHSHLGEQERIAALLDAAIGVAQVQDEVSAQVGPGVGAGFSRGPRSDESGTDKATSDRSTDDKAGSPHATEPVPPSPGPETAGWPFETRPAWAPVTSRPESLSRPGSRETPDMRRPEFRPLIGADRRLSEPPASLWPTRPPVEPAPPVPRWTPRTKSGPVRPGAHEPDLAPAVKQSGVQVPQAVPGTPEEAPLKAAVVPRPPVAPDKAPSAPAREVTTQFLAPAPPSILSFQPDPVSPQELMPPPVSDFVTGGLPPSARRRPSTARPDSDLQKAVAGAVARAAAQGPLMPHGQDEPAVRLKVSQPSAMWPENRPATLPLLESTVAVADPVEKPAAPADLEQVVRATAGQQVKDRREEPAVPANQPAAAAAMPKRNLSRPTGAPSAADSPARVEPTGPHLVEPATGVPRSRESDAASLDLSSAVANEPEPRAPEPSDSEAPSWPVGERRSSARQARKPLPAALQAAVSGEVARPAPAEPSPEGDAARQPSEARGAFPGGAASRTAGDPGPDAKGPGIIRRYGSAIAIVTLFVAAAGAAAAIAAFRGPVSPPPLSTPAQVQAAANAVTLRTGDLPPSWHVSSGGAAEAYGVGSVLVAPALIHAWTATHQGCANDIDMLSTAIMPSVPGASAVASTQATAQDPLGGTWQIADAVAFYPTAAQASTNLAAMRSLVAQPGARACISQYTVSALMSEMTPSSHISLIVSQPPVPVLPGNPPVWALAISGTATSGQIVVPIRFEVTSFAVGRAQVSYAASSKLAPLPASLDEELLVTLATRTEQQAS